MTMPPNAPHPAPSTVFCTYWIWFAAVLVPIGVALLLVPSRGHLGTG